MEEINKAIVSAAERIASADALIISTGAGMGVDSGLPDFRGADGFWKAYPPVAKLGLSFSEMANPVWFDDHPRLAWAFYGHRLNLYRKTIPHKGFGLLLDWAKHKKGGYFVFTSNVDGHFQKAGYDANHIVECHGSINHFQCTAPCSQDIWKAGEVTVDEEKFEAVGALPYCLHCGETARPNVLMFNDWSWVPHRTTEQEYRFVHWMEEIRYNRYQCVIIEIGAGQSVPTVRMKSESLTHREGYTLIRINPREYDVPQEHLALPLNALETLEKIAGIMEC